MRRRSLYDNNWFEYYDSENESNVFQSITATVAIGSNLYLIGFSNWSLPGLFKFDINTRNFSYYRVQTGRSSIAYENKIYMAAYDEHLRAFYIFDTISGVSTAVSKTSNSLIRSIAGIYNNEIYIVSQQYLEIFNLSTQANTRNKSLSYAARFPMTQLYNNKIYTLTSVNGSNLEIIDLMDGNVNNMTISNVAMSNPDNPASMFVKDDKIYLFCSNTIQIYDLSSQNTEIINVPQRNRRAIHNDGNYFYITGLNSNVVEIFNITTKAYKELTIPLTSLWNGIYKYDGDLYLTASFSGSELGSGRGRVAWIKNTKI